MKLSELTENKDNPRKVSEGDFARLVEKLKRNEGGLKAMRIAYVVKNGEKVVISGNTRLRALNQIHGEDWEVPDEYLADLTSLSEAERHEFIVNANNSDGEWDLDKLLEQYTTEELESYGVEEVLKNLPKTDFDDIPDKGFDVEMKPVESKEHQHEVKTVVCPHCGKETKV